MAEVFVCKIGDLTPRSVEALEAAGVVVVQAKNPARCQFLRASEIVSTDDVLFATMKALTYRPQYGSDGREQRARLGDELMAIFQAAHDKKATKAEAE